MLNRRLIILFIAFAIGFSVLALRLGYLQLAHADQWREEIHDWGHRVNQLETYRGAIVDRNGLPLAQDVPSDELAIDYRAMNLDEDWLNDTARARLVASGEWAGLTRVQREQRREQVKAELAARIETIPAAIAQVCQIPQEEVLARFQDIRSRMHALRQHLWSQAFNRKESLARAAATQASAREGALGRWWDGLWAGIGGEEAGSEDPDNDASLDSDFRETQLKEELIAHTIRSNIPAPVANYFRQHAEEYPGLIVRDKANRREYPFGAATAHITGTLKLVDARTVESSEFHFPDLASPAANPGNLRGYLAGDRMGESSAELLLENVVRGTRGAKRIDMSDPATDEPPADTPRIDPQPGPSVRLTIDAAYQRDLYNDLLDPSLHLLQGSDNKNHFVGIVVLSMDGQVLALVSVPSYDPNQIDDIRMNLARDAWRTPLFSRAFRVPYPPGSTVKPLLAAAALSDSLITPEETITCLGHFFPNRTDILRCDLESGHGPISLVDAIAKSCNVYFYTVGQRMGLERLSRWYGRYGFGRQTGMELSEATGHLPEPTAPDADTAAAESRMLGIGQGTINVTPLQMANAYATLLRGGVEITPHILASAAPQRRQMFEISPATLAIVRRGMEACTAYGTGKTVFRDFRPAVAGKTGTAEVDRPVWDDQGNPIPDLTRPLLNPDKSPQLNADGSPVYRQLMGRGTDAWFVGYTPAENPRFIVAAVMEWGGHGAAKAAPLVKQALVQLQRHNYLPSADAP
jgi:penicillin-binding protein 2